MQNVRIPQRVDPTKLAQKRSSYDGVFAKDHLARLADVVVEIERDIEVKVDFDVDLQGIIAIVGNASTAVKCVCERCGEPFTIDLAADFKYTPDQKKIESFGISTEYDFVDTDEFGEIDLLALVEDELMLALPLVPKHDKCPDFEGYWVSGKIEEEAKTNPFAVLKNLKK